MKSRILHKFGIAFLSVLAVGTGRSASAAIIISDNFESYTVGSAPTSPWTSSGSTLLVQQDTLVSTLFGPVGNQYLEYVDTTTGSARLQNLALTSTSNALVAISFDFNEASGTGSGNTDTFNVQFGADVASATTGRSIDLRIGNGDLYYATGTSSTPTIENGPTAVYSFDTRSHIDIIANYGAGSPTYNYGTVAPNKFDVWINGVLVADDVAFRNNQSTNIDSIRLATEGTGVQQFAIDNLTIVNGIDAQAVPEPSMYLMASVGLCLLTLFRSRVK